MFVLDNGGERQMREIDMKYQGNAMEIQSLQSRSHRAKSSGVSACMCLYVRLSYVVYAQVLPIQLDGGHSCSQTRTPFSEKNKRLSFVRLFIRHQSRFGLNGNVRTITVIFFFSIS